MKKLFTSALALAFFALLVAPQEVSAQFPKIKAPKIKAPKIETPKVDDIKIPKGGNDSKTTNGKTTDTKTTGGSKSSGSFSNVTEDPSANSHRRGCDENLVAMDAEYAKPSPSYVELSKLKESTDKKLEFIKKLEPNVDASKFLEKYTPLKTRIEKDEANYSKVKTLEKTLWDKHNYDEKYQQYDFYNYKKRGCYCRKPYDKEVAKDTEFAATKSEYRATTALLVGYTHKETETLLTNAESCYTHANTYAVWMGGENIATLEAFATKNEANEPKDVIKKATEYSEMIDMLAADPSFVMTADSKAKLADGKARVEKIKTSAETYISSGRYQAHLDKLHKEKIAKVFLGKAASKNPTIEKGAMDFVKSEGLGTAVRAVTVDNDYQVAKNDVGIPKWQYREMEVAYKDKDGKCFKVTVYASYTYKGGGTFATVPTYGRDGAKEMACENVNK
jgi:hypothetical protein